MIDAGRWISSREPAPPAVLSDRLATVVGDRSCADSQALAELLVEEAARLLATLHDGRKGAEDLLVADALITYAMEAAADEPDAIEGVAARAVQRLGAVSSRGGQA